MENHDKPGIQALLQGIWRDRWGEIEWADRSMQQCPRGALRKRRPTRLAHETGRDDLIRIVLACVDGLGVGRHPLIVRGHSTSMAV